MSNELTKTESRELAQQPAPVNMSEVFIAMARDKEIDVTRIAALMELQFKAEAREAERQFAAAHRRAIERMPRISKDGKNTGPAGWKYTTLENLDAVIRPIYLEEGLSLSFLSRRCESGVLRVATLRHVGGHFIESEMALRSDKGPGRNDIQADGSAISYADRYLTRGLFNIVSKGEDDDGKASGALTQDQRANIQAMIDEIGVQAYDPFLKFMGVKAVSDIQKASYVPAINYLNAKRKQAAK